MKILVFLVFFSISIEEEYFFRSMGKLDASPAEKCLVQDVNGISYVKKCKKGKYCQIFKNENYIQGICVNFKLPLFVDDACLSNEECLSQNCDNGKCKEQDFCFNDNQCEKGKYCDIHNPVNSDGTNSNSYSCKDMKNVNANDCNSSEECGKFMFCNKETDDTEEKGTCIKIGAIDSGDVFVYINGSYSEKYNKFLCSSGIIEGNTCKTSEEVKAINANDDISCVNNKKCSFDSTTDCQFNPIENNYYCPFSSLQSKAFAKYKEELNKQFEKYENDDKMWNWNNIRLHGEKKDLKEYLFYYENPIFIKYNVEYDINDDDEDALDVIEFLQQIYLNSNFLKINIKKLFFIISMILF
jgi:hypothetical protein